MEAGLWDPVTRAQMLLLRFACKLAASEVDSLPRRVMDMAHRALKCMQTARRDPHDVYRNAPQYQSWSQALLIAVRAFESDADADGFMVTRVTFEQAMFEARPSENLASVGWFVPSGGRNVWQSVERGANDALRILNGKKMLIRSVHAGAMAKNYATGQMEYVWEAHRGATIDEAWMHWSPALRSAEHLSLRERGNRVRQRKVSAQLEEWARAGGEMRNYVLWKRSSYLEPYWFCKNVVAARRLLRARVDCWGNEGSFRRKPHGDLVRLDPWLRACYACTFEHWMPETLEHVFLHCAHGRLRAERERTRGLLKQLIEQAPECGERGPEKPDVSNDVAYMALLQCCTGAGRLEYRQAAAPLDAPLEERRRHPELELSPGTLNTGVVAEVARWIRWWTERWTRDLADERGEAATGRALVEIVCAHALRMRDVRAGIVRRKGVGFDDRVLDPIEVRNGRPDARKQHKRAVAKAAEKKRVAAALRRVEAKQKRQLQQAQVAVSSLSSLSSSSAAAAAAVVAASSVLPQSAPGALAADSAAGPAAVRRRSSASQLGKQAQSSSSSSSSSVSSSSSARGSVAAAPARSVSRTAAAGAESQCDDVRVALSSSSSMSSSAAALTYLPTRVSALTSSALAVAPARPRARTAISILGAAPQSAGARSSVGSAVAERASAAGPSWRGARRTAGESADGQ